MPPQGHTDVSSATEPRGFRTVVTALSPFRTLPALLRMVDPAARRLEEGSTLSAYPILEASLVQAERDGRVAAERRRLSMNRLVR